MLNRIKSLDYTEVNVTIHVPPYCCSFDIRSAKVCPDEGCAAEVYLAEVCLDEVCPAEVCPDEVRLAEMCPAEVCPIEAYPAEVCLNEFCPAEVRPAEVCPAEVRPAEACPAEVCPVEVRPYIGILFSPLIPRLHPFLKNAEMFLVCHDAPFSGSCLLTCTPWYYMPTQRNAKTGQS